MREVDKIKQFIRNIIKREPAILADWLEDRFVPGTDEPYKQEVLHSLRMNLVLVNIAGSNVFMGKCVHMDWCKVNRHNLRYGVSNVPHIKKSLERLYMRNAAGDVNWMFYGRKELVGQVVNPLLFALASLAYGWTTHPLAERALACLTYQPK